jgi:hexokinase
VVEMVCEVEEFYKQYNMDYTDVDMGECVGRFIEEMERGLQGEPSSLPMLPSYIAVEKEIPIHERVIVLDAGGTNFRVATVHFNKDYLPVIEDFSSHRMPGSDKVIRKREFFKTIAGYLLPVVKKSHRIGFCFSYPTEALPDRDGILLYTSKELLVPEVLGEAIGKNLIDTLVTSGQIGIEQVILLNDTVATLLAGRAVARKRRFSSYIGFILGTGSNCSYIEENSNILKIKGLDKAGSQVINAESGAFGKAPRGALDKRFDSSTKDPGLHTFEKMISGRYLGGLCTEVVQAAAADGIFSTASKKKLGTMKTLDTEDMNEFLLSPDDESGTLASLVEGAPESDRAALYHLVDRLVERAAKFTAVHLAAFVLKGNRGQVPCAPVCITAEGSVFYGLGDLKTRVACYLKQFLKEEKKRYYEIIRIENATLIGAAVAGLTN